MSCSCSLLLLSTGTGTARSRNTSSNCFVYVHLYCYSSRIIMTGIIFIHIILNSLIAVSLQCCSRSMRLSLRGIPTLFFLFLFFFFFLLLIVPKYSLFDRLNVRILRWVHIRVLFAICCLCCCLPLHRSESSTEYAGNTVTEGASGSMKEIQQR